MLDKDGLIEAARFSWKCGMAEKLGMSPMLFDFVNNPNNEKALQVEKALKKLFSYVYYCLIALQNDISDPFDKRVVEAHWIGNDLLKKVAKEDLVKLLRRGNKLVWDNAILAWYLIDLLNHHAWPHHSAYALMNERKLPVCLVDARRRCYIDVGEIIRIGTEIEIKNENGSMLCNYGFLKDDNLKRGDLIFVHLGEARKKVVQEEVNRLNVWTKRTLECFN